MPPSLRDGFLRGVITIILFQVNNHSFSTFANTISFNVSRYHTPAEITESKDYKEPAKEAGAKQRDQEMETGASRLTASRPELSRPGLSAIEYVPAEYFRGVQAAQLIQSGQCSGASSQKKKFSFFQCQYLNL